MKIFLLCIILALPSIKVHAAENPVPSLAVLDSIILVPVLATTPVLLADHALFHLEADLRWIDLTSARLAELAAVVTLERAPKQ